MSTYEARRRENDEINLLDLWNVLVEQKKIVFGVTLFAMVLALAYIIMVKPIYMAEAYLLPPLEKDIQAIQSVKAIQPVKLKGSQEVQLVSPEMLVYEQFIVNLNSRSIRKKVFSKHNLINLSDGNQAEKANANSAFEYYNRLLHVSVDNIEKEYVSVSFESGNAEFSANLVNDFINVAYNATRDNLVSNIDYQVASMKKRLEEKIAGKRSLAKQNRLDRIAALNEGLAIAEKLKMVDLTTLQSFANTQGQTLPLYLLGSAALRAELIVLKSRQNDDPFIKNLRYLQEQLSILNHVGVEKEKVLVARIDQSAVAPTRPIKPKKALTMMLALLLGLMLGVGAAFVRNLFWSECRELKSSSML